MKERETGPDLIRCIALFFVITFHSFLYNGYYAEPQIGMMMWLAGSLRWLSTGCIGLFLMLTGYLQSEKTSITACWRRFPSVLLGYFLAAAITIPIRHLVFDDIHSLWDWTQRLFNINALYYGWYVEMYLGLLLLIPFLNIALRHMSSKTLLILSSVMLVLTALPGAVHWLPIPDYWRNLYPFTYYILGAAVRRLRPMLPPLAGIGIALLIASILGGATVLSTDENLATACTWEFPDLPIALIAIFLFISLYHVKPPKIARMILVLGASGCYGGYMLSHLLDARCYALILAWHTPKYYLLLFSTVTLSIFVSSLLGGWLLQKLTDTILHFLKELFYAVLIQNIRIDPPPAAFLVDCYNPRLSPLDTRAAGIDRNE